MKHIRVWTDGVDLPRLYGERWVKEIFKNV